MSRGISEKQEWKNDEKSGCHHNEQRPRKDASATEIDGCVFPRRDLSLQRKRVQQGMASGICGYPNTDCCLSAANEQSGSTAIKDNVGRSDHPVDIARWILQEINLAATFQKPSLATIRF